MYSASRFVDGREWIGIVMIVERAQAVWPQDFVRLAIVFEIFWGNPQTIVIQRPCMK